MTPIMDLDRFYLLNPDRQEDVIRWGRDQFGPVLIVEIVATGEGEVDIYVYLNPIVWIEAPCVCGIIIEASTFKRRIRRTAVTTPPPWLHPDWADQ